MKNISDIIKQISKDPNAKYYSQIAKVKSVDENKRVCDVELVMDEIDMFNVRIQAEINSTKGIAIIPKKDSFVVVTFISKTLCFISVCSEVEKILIDIPEVSGVAEKIKIKNTKIELNDGNNAGIVKVKELTQKVNKLETQLNQVLTILKTTVIPLAPSGTYPFAPLYSALSDIVLTNQNEIENPDIKH